MVIVRRGDLDFDDDLMAAAVLALCFWVFAIGLGSFVRNVRAGHALRLDADGLHVPGLDVVPWRASVESAELRGYGDSGKRFRQLVVHTDAFRNAPSVRRYERYVFGPWAGLAGSGQGRRAGRAARDRSGVAARGDARSSSSSDTRAAIRENVAASAQDRRTSGRRLP